MSLKVWYQINVCVYIYIVGVPGGRVIKVCLHRLSLKVGYQMKVCMYTLRVPEGRVTGKGSCELCGRNDTNWYSSWFKVRAGINYSFSGRWPMDIVEGALAPQAP